MPLRPLKPGPCNECGDSPIFHRVTYISIVIDDILSPFARPNPVLKGLVRWVYSLERVFTPYMLQGFVALKLARFLPEPDERTTLLGKLVWEEAKRRGIKVVEFRLFDLPRNMFLATFPDGRKLAYEGIPVPPSDFHRVPWMDNKAELKRRFQKSGIPVAKGGAAYTLQGAKRIFSRITPPAIVKPHSGSGSRHTTLNIDTPEELARAFHVTKQVTPFAVIEEELSGLVYRVTVVNGKLFAVLRRFPPTVIGDGVHTVEELVAKENEHPLRQGPFFCHIPLGTYADRKLSRQGFTKTSIPKEGEEVILHQKINWTVGGTTEDATDDVHPENVELFERIARELKAPVMGMDFIIGDMREPWSSQERCGVLECNSMPFFENHYYVFRGTARNPAEPVWDMVEAAR